MKLSFGTQNERNIYFNNILLKYDAISTNVARIGLYYVHRTMHIWKHNSMAHLTENSKWICNETFFMHDFQPNNTMYRKFIYWLH